MPPTPSNPDVPLYLLAECPHPLVYVRTNGGLAEGLAEYSHQLNLCNRDKETLRSILLDTNE